MSSGGELELQRAVDAIASERGWRLFALPVVQKVRTPARVKGWPDRVYFRRGRIVVLEFKAEKDTKVTAEQESWLDEWRAVALHIASCWDCTGELPVKVALVRPSDYDKIVGWLA